MQRKMLQPHLLLLATLFSSVVNAAVSGTASANEINHLQKRKTFNLGGALYPQASETRDLRTLNGIWNFRKSPMDPEYGYRNGWYEQDLDKVKTTCALLGLPPEDCQYFVMACCMVTLLNGCWFQILEESLLGQLNHHPFHIYVNSDAGLKQNWFLKDLHKTGAVIPMPVPSSYNDIGEDASLRDHVGLVWYDRRFHVPPWWLRGNQRVWLRFSSVHYAAQVWVNGKQVTYHEIGHLPFEVEITDVVHHNTSNLLTVAVDNTLLSDTVPQGSIRDIFAGKNKTRQEQLYTFDFFNYAGIHRTVFLYSTPQLYIDDVIVNTDIQGLTGFVVYNVTYKGPTLDDVQCLIQLYDKSEIQVAALQDCAGLLEVPNANMWWPHLMHPDPGYLYTFKASLIGINGELIDTYIQKIGIRTVTWTNTTIYLNDKPIYMRGFGMHEDSDLRGKGWDPVLWVKNFNLIRWVGANAFRTSHYPYAEEIYQMADEQGIMIIDECPSGDTDYFTEALLTKHKQSLTELIRRDKNHPSVVMWSIANEPRSYKKEADNYFKEVVRHVKSMDLSRPVTIAISWPYTQDRAGQHLDVICFNRYNGWYSDTGSLTDIASKVTDEATNWHHQHNKPIIMTEYGADTIPGLHRGQHLDVICFNRYNGWYHDPGSLINIAKNVVEEATAWRRTHNKPVMMAEYGADTIEGLHRLPEYVWSEEYQVALMSEHFKAFDKLRRARFFNGEFIWNFADFMTQQTTTRVGGNKKGIFTRQRQPKASAHHLRARYLALSAADAGAAPPDAAYYVSDHKPANHEEL